MTKTSLKAGKLIGFFIANVIFFSILYLILSTLGKIQPGSINYTRFLLVAILILIIYAIRTRK